MRPLQLPSSWCADASACNSEAADLHIRIASVHRPQLAHTMEHTICQLVTRLLVDRLHLCVPYHLNSKEASISISSIIRHVVVFQQVEMEEDFVTAAFFRHAMMQRSDHLRQLEDIQQIEDGAFLSYRFSTQYIVAVLLNMGSQ